MIESFKTVYEGGVGEIIEKKSRFIATVFPIKSEDEATSFIESMRKKYWDANHNCYAYVLGKNDEIRRCSDDGEPAKTAGVPILDVLLLEEIHNTAIVVTRYFGGTLLGTGGLVRAYQSASKMGLLQSIIIEKKLGERLQVITDYTSIGKLQYIIASLDMITLNTIFTDVVELCVIASNEITNKFKKEALEATSGKVTLTTLDSIYYANVLGEIQIFEE